MLLTYLLGSVPFGLLLVRWQTGKDVREHGSGNIGATNVARVAGWRIAGIVLALDAAKGFVPAAVAWYVLELSTLSLAAGFAAVIGHCWSIWLRGKGGKGVATSAGVLLALVPIATVPAAVIWWCVYAITKKSSLAAMVALVVIQGLIWMLDPKWLSLSLPLAGILIVCHRANIRRLLTGSELGV